MAGFKNIKLLTFIAVFVCFGFAGEPSYGVEVKEIRHFSSETYTRVVIDVSAQTKYTYHLLKKDPSLNKPRRLFVDIESAKISKKTIRDVHVNDGLLRSVRAGQNKSDVVRVVLDLESVGEVKVFHLKKPFRIVIDVFSDGDGIKTIHGSSTKPPVTVKDDKPSSPKIVKKDDSIKKLKSKGIKVIVIDAGHGGKDPGAMGKKKSKEKDLTLKLVKMLKKELSKSLPDTKIILTRDKDVFIALEKRTAIANSKNADLFISIHINASPRGQARGLETYFLDYTHDKEAMRVAARENATTPSDMSDLEFIIRDMTRGGNRVESSRLATSVQKKMVATLSKKYSGIKNLGVKGAPFYVLVSSNMPSILVEVGFISNKEELKRLHDNKYQVQIIEGIEAGILEYIKGIK